MVSSAFGTLLRIWSVLCLAALVGPGAIYGQGAAGPSTEREWRDVEGRTIRAELIEVIGDQVRIRREDNREFVLPIGRLSQADQDYVAGWNSRPRLDPLAAIKPGWAQGPANSNHNAGLGQRPLRLSPSGTVRAGFIFVDFPDARAKGSTASHADLILPRAGEMLRGLSYGKLVLEATVVPEWFRMPRRSTEYGFSRGISFDAHRAYIVDALHAADAAVDFSRFDMVCVFATREAAAITFSPAFAPVHERWGILVDGKLLLNGVTLGQDVWNPAAGAPVLVHEMGHLLDLPDLYAFAGDTHRFVGEWDLMGQYFGRGSELLAWQRCKLGWISDKQVRAITRDGALTETLSPVARPDGVKLIAVPLGPRRLLVVESRTREGLDRNLPVRGGILVYEVDASVSDGNGPIKVLGDLKSRSLGLLTMGRQLVDPSGQITIKYEASNPQGDTVTVTVNRSGGANQ